MRRDFSFVDIADAALIGVNGNLQKSEGYNLLILRAGDGDRTHDVQLGKSDVD